MQAMPKASCHQRNGEGSAATARASIDMCLPFQALLAAMLKDQLPRRNSAGGPLHPAISLYQRLTWLITSNFLIVTNKKRQSTIINPGLTCRRVLAAALAWLTAGFLAAAALADDKSAAPAGEPPALAETQHSITLG